MASDPDTSWIAALTRTNFLAIYELILAILEARQFGGTAVTIPLLPPLFIFRELMPAVSPPLCDRYCDLRWKAAHLLSEKGALSVHFLKGSHRWKGQLEVGTQEPTFSAIVAAFYDEYKRRNPGSSKPAQAAAVPAASQETALDQLRNVILRFHAVAVQLRDRRRDRSTLEIADEYDVQDLLHALLRIFFDDVRPEEWTPSYAGRSSRVDFLLKPERIVIEAKKTRPGHAEKEIGDELIIDATRYAAMESCSVLVCMVYDPENRLANPGGFEADLTRASNGLAVEVIVVPKQY